MDVKEYISSGILESYVLGTASSQEQQEVQCLSKIYPEITEALRALEDDMEKFAGSLAQAPPPELKVRILESIKDLSQENPLKASQPSAPEQTVLTVSKTKRPWLAIASLAALIGLTVIFFINQSQQQKEILTLQNRVYEADKSREQLGSINELLAQQATRKIELKGTESQPNANVSVFWNDQTQDVAFKVNSLPPLPEDKDYQLWAIVDGKPTDMGVMDYQTALSGIVRGNKKVSNAQAFAITIEPKGGSKDPTLSSMIVVGEI